MILIVESNYFHDVISIKRIMPDMRSRYNRGLLEKVTARIHRVNEIIVSVLNI